MTAPTPQKKLEIQQSRQIVADRYLRGQTQWQIANCVEVTQATISYDLAAIRTEWLESSLRDFNARKAQELAKIDLIERE
jgi:hypothetical protein